MEAKITEDQMQVAIWKRLWNTYPQLRRKVWHVPNEGNANAIEGARMKAKGVLEGVWDLHIFHQGYFIIAEGKVGGNQLTKDRIDKKGKKHFGQEEWGEVMRREGALAFVFRSEEEFFNKLDLVLTFICNNPRTNTGQSF